MAEFKPKQGYKLWVKTLTLFFAYKKAFDAATNGAGWPLPTGVWFKRPGADLSEYYSLKKDVLARCPNKQIKTAIRKLDSVIYPTKKNGMDTDGDEIWRLRCLCKKHIKSISSKLFKEYHVYAKDMVEVKTVNPAHPTTE